MSKIQGKQIENLLIGTPTDNSYTGVFSLDPTTKVADAVDKINDILGKLAPTAPSTIWTNTFTALTLSGGLSGRMVNTTTDYTGVIYNTSTPTISVTSTFTTPLAQATAKALPSSPTTLPFSLSDNIHGSFETLSIPWNATSGSSSNNRITYTVGDPYSGIVGKLGIWSGITSLTLSGTIPSTPAPITASTTKNTLTFSYPNNSITYDFYVDSSSTPTISAVTLVGSLTRYVSGVPSLVSNASLSLGFTISGAVSYFYNNNLFDISNIGGNTYIQTQSNQPPQSPPEIHGDDIIISGKVVQIANTSKYSETISLGITARSVSAASSVTTATPALALRVDTVSNETLRFLSGWGTWTSGTYSNGNGSYPDSVYGDPFVSTNVLNPSTPNDYSHELMLINGVYKYPSGDFRGYTDSNTFVGPNYTNSGTDTRWATFKFINFGTVDSKKSSFVLSFNNTLTGVGTSDFTNSNLLIEAKVDGAGGESTWVNCTKYFVIGTNPGNLVNDIGGLNGSSLNSSTRTIEFGSYSHYGTLVIRIGIKYNSGITFKSVSIT